MSVPRGSTSVPGGAHSLYSFNGLTNKIRLQASSCKAGRFFCTIFSGVALMGSGVERARQAAERGELTDRLGRKMTPAQIDNLRPAPNLRDMDPDKRRAIQQAGARASNETKERRRTIKEIYDDLLQQPDNLEGLEDAELTQRVQQSAEQRGRSVTLYEAIAVAMAAKAKAGDVKAAVFVRDSAGDKPADAVEITAETMTDADRRLLQRIQDRLQNDDTTTK